MDVNKILTPALLRLINDEELLNILGGNIKAVKGPRKPTNWDNPCFTIHIPSNHRDPDFKTHNGTMIINFYCDNYPSGNANVELMGPVTDRVVEIYDDKPLEISGYNNYNLHVEEPMGPLWDPDEPNEHFMSIRIRLNLIKTN